MNSLKEKAVIFIPVVLLLLASFILSNCHKNQKRKEGGWERHAAQLIEKRDGKNELKDILFLNDIFPNYESVSLREETFTKKYAVSLDSVSVLKGSSKFEKDYLLLQGAEIFISILGMGELIGENKINLLEMETSADRDIQIDAYVTHLQDVSVERLKEHIDVGGISRYARFVFQTFDYRRPEFGTVSIDFAQKFKFEDIGFHGIVLKISSGSGQENVELKLRDIYLLNNRSKIIEQYPSLGYFTWGRKTLESVYLPTGCTIAYRIDSDEKTFFDGYLGAFQNSRVTYRVKVNQRDLLNKTVGHGLDYFAFVIEPEDDSILLEIEVDGAENDLGVLGNLSLFKEVEKKNVFFYLIDALRPDYAGIPRELFESYFNNGAVFTRAFANATRTADALPVIFSGKYKFMFVQHPVETPYLQEQETLLTEYLKQKGYVTAAFIGNPWLVKSNSLQGFDYVEYAWKHVDRPFLSAGAYKARKYGDLEQSLRDFVKNNKQKPLFIYLHTMEPHRPYELPLEDRHYSAGIGESILEKIKSDFTNSVPYPSLDQPEEAHIDAVKALYRDSLLSAFSFFEKTHQMLQAEGVLDDSSLLILTSDHGERLFEHGSWIHGPPDIFNEVLRVPLMIRGRGINSGTYYENVQHADLYPTVTDWFGDAAPEDMVGDSLLEYVRGGMEDPRWKERVIYADGAAHHLQYACIQGDTKVIINKDKAEVYDLLEDPLERQDVSQETRFESSIELSKRFRDNFEVRYSLRKKELTDEEIRRLKALGYIK